MGTLIQFHVLFGKSALECCKLLKEGLGTHAPLYQTVCRWVYAIKNDQEETDSAPHSVATMSVMNECHMEQVKSVLVHIHSISCTAMATEVGISLASVYHVLTNSLGKQEVCAVWIAHMHNDDQRATHVLVTTHLQPWRN